MKKFTLKLLLLLICLGICLQVFSATVLNYVLSFMPAVMDSYAELEEALVQLDIMNVIFVGVLAPVLEETVFRLLILHFGAKIIPFWIMNIIQAVLFGVYHGNWVQGVYAFLLGMILGYILHVSGWILSSIVLHMSINMMGLLMQKIPIFAGDMTPLVVVLAVVSLVLGGAIIYYIKRQDNKGDYHGQS